MFLYLAEMFDNLSLDQIEKILLSSPSSSIQQLIDQCIDADNKNSESKNTENFVNTDNSNNSSEAYEMIPLMPATTFHSSEPQSIKQSNELKKRIDESLSNLYSSFRSSSLSFEQQYKLLQTLSRIIDNLLSHPTTEKYRVLPLTNEAFKTKVLSVKGSLEVLKSLGFIEIEGGNILMIEGENIEILNFSRSLIEQKMTEIQIHLPQSPPTNETQKGVGKLIPSTRNFHSIDENPLYQNKRDWKPNPAAAVTQKPAVRLTREQLAAVAEHRLNPSSTPSPSLPASSSTINQRRGRVMNLHSQSRYRRELELMRQEKKNQWSNTSVGRKRVITISDLEEMRKSELDAHAKFGTGMLSDDAYVEIGKEALKLTNEFRASEGINEEIHWHQQVAEIGWIHSRNMGDGKAEFSHDGFDDRVRQYPMPHRGAGENLFMASGVGAASIAKAAVDGWIQSPGHRKNLLGRWNYCGIGVYRNAQGAFYLTQLFALAT